MDKRISRKFFNDRAEHWDETVRNNDPQKLRSMADRLIIKNDDRVLDVGTGTGVFIPHIAEKLNGGGKIISMDYAINMLYRANAKFPQNGSLRYICAEIETLHMNSDVFDVATCYSTFPHFHDKPKALDNLRHLLRSNGILYICHTAGRETINDIHRNIPDFQDHLIPDNESMTQLLKDAGFTDIFIEDDSESYLVKARNGA
jgi:demethylmenaquinone methyltransferase/2-methoxy-6-polyprenyl-1,4-benzoquinol methylase